MALGFHLSGSSEIVSVVGFARIPFGRPCLADGILADRISADRISADRKLGYCRKLTSN